MDAERAEPDAAATRRPLPLRIPLLVGFGFGAAFVLALGGNVVPHRELYESEQRLVYFMIYRGFATLLAGALFGVLGGGALRNMVAFASAVVLGSALAMLFHPRYRGPWLEDLPAIGGEALLAFALGYGITGVARELRRQWRAGATRR